MDESVLDALEYLILSLPALAVAWALAVWLPGRAFKRASKLGLAALISYVGLLLPMVSLMVAGFLGTFLNAIAIVTFPLLFTIPTMHWSKIHQSGSCWRFVVWDWQARECLAESHVRELS